MTFSYHILLESQKTLQQYSSQNTAGQLHVSSTQLQIYTYDGSFRTQQRSQTGVDLGLNNLAILSLTGGKALQQRILTMLY